MLAFRPGKMSLVSFFDCWKIARFFVSSPFFYNNRGGIHIHICSMKIYVPLSGGGTNLIIYRLCY